MYIFWFCFKAPQNYFSKNQVSSLSTNVDLILKPPKSYILLDKKCYMLGHERADKYK
jgi:hypothetical protein